VAFSWAVLYLTLAAIPLVFQRNHGFSLQQANAVFAAMCVGALIASALSIYQERFARKAGKFKNTPEDRLYFACVESACLPIGLFMFGWTSASSIHWIVPTIAVSIATIGIFTIYLCVFNYLADTYHRYASSALAAQSFCRNMLGTSCKSGTTKQSTDVDSQAASSLSSRLKCTTTSALAQRAAYLAALVLCLPSCHGYLSSMAQGSERGASLRVRS
jgi:hypothetical protein